MSQKRPVNMENEKARVILHEGDYGSMDGTLEKPHAQVSFVREE
jgi:hypothetical protein